VSGSTDSVGDHSHSIGSDGSHSHTVNSHSHSISGSGDHSHSVSGTTGAGGNDNTGSANPAFQVVNYIILAGV